MVHILFSQHRRWLARTAGFGVYVATVAAVLVGVSLTAGLVFTATIHFLVIFGRVDLLHDIARYAHRRMTHPNPLLSPVTWSSIVTLGLTLFIGDRLGTRLGTRVIDRLTSTQPSEKGA